MNRSVIVYQNPDGPNVCVTYPVGKTVEELIADYPTGRIVLESTLPTEYFDAWRIVGDDIVVDLQAAKNMVHEQLNYNAVQKAKERSDSASIGLSVAMSSEDFLASIQAIRTQIDAASTVAGLSQISLVL